MLWHQFLVSSHNDIKLLPEAIKNKDEEFWDSGLIA
jgi:hypothetical protein